MVDTRIEGRDRQYDNYGDADGGLTRYINSVTPDSHGNTLDAGRHMLSKDQQDWLVSKITASSATWQLIGNQDIMGKMWIPYSVLQYFGGPAPDPVAGQAAVTAYLTAKVTRAVYGTSALTPAQAALLNPATNPRLPYNLDSWDGYPTQREVILQTVKALGKHLVALSGDSHNGWFNKLTTFSGEKVGVEFAGSSVTSGGFESVGLGSLGPALDGSSLTAQIGPSAVGAGLGLIDDLGYADSVRRGYLLMTVTGEAVTGQYMYVSTVKSKTYTSSIGRTITVTKSGDVTYA
jgi:alkaline phosphatase D